MASSNEIKLSTPPKPHELDAVQEMIAIHADTGDTKRLQRIGSGLESKSQTLERKGHHDGASRVADLAALAINSANDIIQ